MKSDSTSTHAGDSPSGGSGRGTRIDTPCHTVVFDAEGVLHTVVRPGAEVDLAEAHLLIRSIAAVVGEVARPMVVNLAGARSLSRDARRFLHGVEARKALRAVGLIVASPLSRALGNFFMGVDKNAVEVQLFASEEEAVRWARELARS